MRHSRVLNVVFALTMVLGFAFSSAEPPSLNDEQGAVIRDVGGWLVFLGLICITYLNMKPEIKFLYRKARKPLRKAFSKRRLIKFFPVLRRVWG